MSDYREELNTLQLVALDIMFRTGEGSTEALVSAKEILDSGRISKAKTENFKYILFYADFDEGESTVTEFEFLSDITDEHVDTSILDELVKRGVYVGEWHSWHLIKVKA